MAAGRRSTRCGPKACRLYLDAGLKILKLGEEAIVPLADFTLQGGRWSGLRYALKRGERDGLAIEMLAPEAAAQRLDTLGRISDAWLASRRARRRASPSPRSSRASSRPSRSPS